MSEIEPDGAALLAYSQSVHLRVPLESSQLLVLRAVARSIAMREDLDMDATADFTLIVDEIYGVLADVAGPVSLLRCFFSHSDTEVAVHAYVFAAPGVTLEQDRTAHLFFLHALADEIRVWQTPSEDTELGQCHIEATLGKRAAG